MVNGTCPYLLPLREPPKLPPPPPPPREPPKLPRLPLDDELELGLEYEREELLDELGLE
jgi:hypothetical protein